MSELVSICGTSNPNRRGDVVFVHGLNGDARTTWHPKDQPDEFWPSWLCEDMPEIGVWSVGYEVNSFGWKGSTMPLADRAVNALVLLDTYGIGKENPVVFITHSLGGLLVKEMLRKATDNSVTEGQQLAEHTKGVVFLSTPHSGSDLANFVDFLKVLLPTDSVRELKPNEPRLRELNTWYRNNVSRLGIETQVYRESKPTKAGQGCFKSRIESMVVDANSSDPGIAGVTAVPLDEDHLSISSPKRDSLLYRRISEFVKEEFKEKSEPAAISKTSLPEEKPTSLKRSVNFDTLVQEVRAKIQHNIQEQCGTIKVLEKSNPIALGQIYTQVNILKEISGNQRQEIDDLVENCGVEEFERIGLGPIQQSRVPSLEVAQEYSKLMVLGKPGSGKTTFMRFLAMECISGKFKSDFVPIFITLKQYSDDLEQPSLKDYIAQYLAAQNIENSTELTETLLMEGRFLLLLDGLDEVQDDEDRVYSEIVNLSNFYHNNAFFITCRISSSRRSLNKFIDVEVADFDENQIINFVRNWFSTEESFTCSEDFLKKLNQERRIQELASNPLLLTLLCLVFQQKKDFPKKRSELYDEGIDIFLIDWDNNKGVERAQVNKGLSLSEKRELLGSIAQKTFENGKYFIKQKELEEYVERYISILPSMKNNVKTTQPTVGEILKAIESDHGLFVVRAKKIYSFSHLTFHEYFVAREIVSSPDLTKSLEYLARKVTEKRWREVFLLVLEMLPEPQVLLNLMKQKVDLLLVNNEKLQRLLLWMESKASAIETRYKAASVRLLYFLLVTPTQSNYEAQQVNGLLGFFGNFTEMRTIVGCVYNPNSSNPIQNFPPGFFTDFCLLIALDAIPRCTYYDGRMQAVRPLLWARTSGDEFASLFQRFPIESESAFRDWTNDLRLAWKEEFRNWMIRHRNIGHDWQLTDEELAAFTHYLEANKLLLDCLINGCYDAPGLREEIENSLFLPL
jgi:pimeloyl-ACP methyl ester carboxylesterase